MSTRRRLALQWAALGSTVACALAACGPPPSLSAHDDSRLQVVTTTGLLRDIVENVGGDRVNAVSIIPDGADPHSFEPTLRSARDVVYADVAFSNYLMLEQQSVVKTLDANLREGVPNVSLAEDAVKYAAEIIQLVENPNLDTIWLGLRARGSGERHGADRSSEVLLSATEATGPGDVFGYLTGTFGETEVYFDSSDGFDAGNGYRDDTASLPTDAHTHMSWVFTEPGVYTLTLKAALQLDEQTRPIPIGESTFTFVVGVSPHDMAGDRTVLDEGHADLTVDLEAGELYALYDPSGGGEHTQVEHQAQDIVIAVPNKAIDEIPEGPGYEFLGRAGTQIYQLPQAVLGKHVHGEIDPHLWQNVGNVMAYAKLIRDTLISADPEGAAEYRAATDAYIEELDELDTYVRQRIAAIPASRRHLVTTHDAFGYLAAAYGIDIAGFVTPNPATEPSLVERRRLVRTIQTLEVPAVFLEPNLRSRSSVLTQIAQENDVEVCDIYADTFDERVHDYVTMMRFNADSLYRCLTRGLSDAELSHHSTQQESETHHDD
ncbi:anchored repeat ABC transporter, substrate-binding protein [uncultured Aeromicrobium sp.]|uniref:anchored repeat ABC transporter, substrate-binding protein n=1 Tax=uncultured Aeromicrobium sp. TaxID=337820 RepID=UPI0025E38160|nr:anchored repeat ABC transporter, substrate-binding protein [uncultured Aeromicrobium sp.]